MKWLSGWIFPQSNPFPKRKVVGFLMKLDKTKPFQFLKFKRQYRFHSAERPLFKAKNQ
jgi:hypothetical protein